MANNHRAMISQQQDLFAGSTGQDPFTLIHVYSDAFKVVVGYSPVQLGRIKVAVRQPLLQTANCQGGGGMHMHHTMAVGNLLMDSAMKGETGRIDWPIRLTNNPPLDIHLDQV